MIDIENYIKKPQAERQRHIDLSLPCEVRGGCSKDFRILLARLCDTNLPMKGAGRKIHLAHACNNKSCCNHAHLYWATAKENMEDHVRCGARAKAIQKGLSRFSSDAEKRSFYASIGSAGGLGNSGRVRPGKNTHLKIRALRYAAIDYNSLGWVGKAAEILGIEPQSVRRWMTRYCPEMLENVFTRGQQRAAVIAGSDHD